MEFWIDSANLEDIQACIRHYPVTGVTTNPSILAKEGCPDVFGHLKEIHEALDASMGLHVQVLGDNYEAMVEDAASIHKHLGSSVYVKIPATEQGFRAMRFLKSEGYRVTATVVYTKMQGFMALACGADYVAPYCNRMDALGIDFCGVIRDLRHMIDADGSAGKIIAASFRSSTQICDALVAGAHGVTVPPSLLRESLRLAAVEDAMKTFETDWLEVYGSPTLPE